MEPILKENYILTKDSYFGFTLDQNKKALDKNRKSIKIMSYIQIGVGVLFISSMAFSGQKVGALYFVLAAALIITGFSGTMRTKGYEKKINSSLEKSYEAREYGKNMFEVIFYDDRLKYSVGEQSGDIEYSEFSACYDGEKYFAIHFLSGEVIIFNRDCGTQRIREIFDGYKAEHPYDEDSEEIEKAKTEDKIIEIDSKEELADDWYMNIEETTKEA